MSMFLPMPLRTRLLPLLALAGGLTVGLALLGCNSQPTAPKDPPPGNRIFTPAWYEDTPPDEEGTIYKTAQAAGSTATMSENMAINQARQEMALSIESRVDVLQRSFEEQVDTTWDPELLRRFQNINQVVSSRMLRGSNVVRKETYGLDQGRYRTYVLMQLDARAIEAMYLQQLQQIEELETRLRSTEAWKNLEKRTEQLRQERMRMGLPPMTDEEIQGDG